MRKLPGIVAWFVTFVGLVCLGLSFVGGNVSTDAILTDLWGTNLSNFNHRLEAYTADTGGMPVLVGPSYAAYLDSPKGTHNLGIISARPEEVLTVIYRDCRKDQRIFYFLTLREFYHFDTPCRPGLDDNIGSRIELARLLIRDKLGIPSRKNQPPHPMPGERDTLLACANLTEASSLNSRTALIYIKQAAQTGEIDIGHLVKLQEDFPRMVFVLSPTLPLQSDGADMLLSRQIERVIEKEDELVAKLRSAPITTLDLSSLISSNQFIDYFHVNKASRKTLSAQLQRYPS